MIKYADAEHAVFYGKCPKMHQRMNVLFLHNYYLSLWLCYIISPPTIIVLLEIRMVLRSTEFNLRGLCAFGFLCKVQECITTVITCNIMQNRNQLVINIHFNRTKDTICHCSSHHHIIAYISKCLIPHIEYKITFINYSLLLHFLNIKMTHNIQHEGASILFCYSMLTNICLQLFTQTPARPPKSNTERYLGILTQNWKCRKVDKTFGTATGNRLSRVCKYTSNSFCLFSTRVLEFLPMIFFGGNRCLSIFFSKMS